MGIRKSILFPFFLFDCSDDPPLIFNNNHIFSTRIITVCSKCSTELTGQHEEEVKLLMSKPVIRRRIMIAFNSSTVMKEIFEIHFFRVFKVL